MWDDLIEDAGEGERVHSRFAPSALKRIITCPRSVALSEALGAEGKSSVYAAEGSVAHLVAEKYLHRADWIPPSLAAGSVVEHEGHSVIIDAEMHRCGLAYADYVRSLMVPGDVLFIENTVRLDAIVGEDKNMYGHLDAAIWSPARRTLIIVDYKYGRGIKVSALENPQLMAYALGAMFTLPGVNPDDVRRVEAHIFQPRVTGASPHDAMHALDLLEWGNTELAPVLSLIEKDGAIQRPYVSGDHCRFCPAKAQCPALRERALQAAAKAFEAKPIKPSALSDDEMADVLNEVDVVEIWFDAARKEGLRRALAGKRIGDRKVVEGRGKRVWKAEDTESLDEALSEFGLGNEMYEPDEIKSVAQIEKLITPDKLEAFKELWTSKSSGYVLVPASDRRKPVQVLPANEVFKNHPLPKEQ